MTRRMWLVWRMPWLLPGMTSLAFACQAPAESERGGAYELGVCRHCPCAAVAAGVALHLYGVPFADGELDCLGREAHDDIRLEQIGKLLESKGLEVRVGRFAPSELAAQRTLSTVPMASPFQARRRHFEAFVAAGPRQAWFASASPFGGGHLIARDVNDLAYAWAGEALLVIGPSRWVDRAVASLAMASGTVLAGLLVGWRGAGLAIRRR